MWSSIKLGLLILLTLSLFCSCAEDSISYRSQPEKIRLPQRSAMEPVREAPASRGYPWETWGYGRDLNGVELKNLTILRGDEYRKAGEKRKALDQYLHAQSENLVPDEREALVMRIASTQLALDQPDQALSTLGEFFHRTGRGEDDVDARFSLLFGYAYGRKNDVPQSLAWFSRTNSLTHGKGFLAGASEQGIKLLFRSLPEEQFNSLTDAWADDTFVRNLLGQESKRRASGGFIEPSGQDTQRLLDESFSIENQEGTAPSAESVIGVLLPLSGKFTALGTSMKNGMTLAFEGQGLDSHEVEVLYRDTGEDVTQALTQARELVGQAGASLILGPLLSEPAQVVADFARQNHITLLTFSKKSSLPVGDGVFRLGATNESQIESLIDVASTKLGIKKFALVYPDDSLDVAQAFKAGLQDRGEVVYESAFKRDDINALVALAAEVERSHAEAVFFPDSLVSASRFFSSFSTDARAKIRPLGIGNWDNIQQLSNSSTVLEGAVFVSPFFPTQDKPLVAKFIEAYKFHFNQNPDFLAAQGFDAATLIAAALKRRQEEGISIIAALHDVELYDGLTGRISIEQSGELRRTFSVVELSQGKLNEITDVAETPTFVFRGNDKVDVKPSTEPE